MNAPLTFQLQAALWGQSFEVAVKRGVLACLIHKGLLKDDHPVVATWRATRLTKLYTALVDQLGSVDEEVRNQQRTAAQHQVMMGYCLGYTVMREYLAKLARPLELQRLQLKALWCPLALPGPRDPEAERAENRQAFGAEFGLPEPFDIALTDRGMPANADFSLWLSGKHEEDHLLVLEFSYDAADYGDFQTEDAHLQELLRYRRLVDSRGVFARVAAQVEQERFELSDDIKTHLSALTGRNKPLYKLCQGSAYAESTVAHLTAKGLLSKPCIARSMAVTPNGVESIAARIDAAGEPDPRFGLMRQLGDAYRRATKLSDGDEEGVTEEIEKVFTNLLRRLPLPLYDGLSTLRRMPAAGEDFELDFCEEVPEFTNPTQEFTREEALGLIDESDPALQAFFGGSPRAAVDRALKSGRISLRDLHAAAVVAGMQTARPGKLTALALEGNPGIGKTTAVREHLSARDSGYLFFYVSPRVVINREVTEQLGRRDGEPTGILTVTTNAELIAAAERWHEEQVTQGKASRRHIDAAVVADGVAELNKPQGNVLVLTPQEEEEIDKAYADSRLSKEMLSENEDQLHERPLLGVLSAMSQTTRELLQRNPQVNRTVLTAALQGFREKENRKTTVEALSKLFKNKAASHAGIEERRAFAKRMPLIVVMVDELAGDGAGAPFVHAVSQWLRDEFITPFEGDSPFTVVLIISDASLANEVVLERYLDVGNRSPDKVLVSKSKGEQCFRLAATRVRLGIGPRDTLHVMTNSFPASKLTVQYRVNMTAVRLTETAEGVLKSPRKAIIETVGEILLDGAVREIHRALEAGASQVIFFAQDKQFLGTLRGRLSDAGRFGLTRETTAVLDSSVPGWIRRKLVEEKRRDGIKVFLMTSSGARGVSFPKTDWIIATVPRFQVETALMEITQLIYRGRGRYHDENGEVVLGDNVPRRLVMLVNDYLPHESELDKRQWLRQSSDLMTLLVMLRAAIYTRIMGDAGLKRQRLALVPVGAVGLEELMTVMSSYVTSFIREADVYVKRGGNKELNGVVTAARANVTELFARFRLHGNAKRGTSAFSFARPADMSDFFERTVTALWPLLPSVDETPQLPDHIYCAGPILVERWEGFDKREVFFFEGWETSTNQLTRQLYKQLRVIDKQPELPSKLRIPARNLYRILAREKPDAANEFSTLKDLKSPNTWVIVPLAYMQFMKASGPHNDRVPVLAEPELWQEALGRTLSGNGSVMPPIPRYDAFPWVAGIYQGDPLRMDLAFDDRYFMASNELNLLNTLLLAEPGSTAGARAD